MASVEVEVLLPKFRLQESYDMRETLISMGMSDAFNRGKADLTGISDKNDLYLSKVFHKAFVDVNEEGTEAAAATAATVVLKMSPMSARFEADHPFLFCIQEKKTGSILFCGRVTSP